VPLIRVDAAVCKGSSTSVELTQAEFSRDQPNKKALRWRVPVTLQVTGTDRQARTLVTGGKATVSVPGCGTVIVNAGQSGYYRTLYAPKHFRALAAGFAGFAPIDQLGRRADSWSLGLAGLQPASDFLELANAATPAADPQVWGKIASVLKEIHGHYAGDKKRQSVFDRYAIARLAPVFQQIGWSARAGENATVATLRAELIDTLSELGDPATVAEARRRYLAEASDPQAVPGALRKTIMGVVAQHADSATWDGLRRAALAEKSPMAKDQLYHELASSRDDALARRALELAMTDEPGVTNSAAMLAEVAKVHPEMAFDFALAHIAKVNDRVDATSRSRYFPRLAAGSADAATITKLDAYAVANLAAGSRRDADTAIASIKDRIKVRAQRLPAIDAWLAAHAK
jgi:aminopeptidase N